MPRTPEGTDPQQSDDPSTDRDQQDSDDTPADDSPAYPHSPEQAGFDDIRNDLQDGPGGLHRPDSEDQQALADAVPRDEDGNFQRHPDPYGDWAMLQNDGGINVPGRADNCADGSRAFLETWYGDPQVSAPRMDDGEFGERNGVDNIEAWAGGQFQYSGEGPQAYSEVAHDLREAGHGASAIIYVDWVDDNGNPDGSHVFNAVNYNGTVVFVDPQTGDVMSRPINTEGVGQVFHLPLDADRNPLYPDSDPAAESSEHGYEPQGKPSHNDSDPAADPADAHRRDTATETSDQQRPQPPREPANGPTQQPATDRSAAQHQDSQARQDEQNRTQPERTESDNGKPDASGHRSQEQLSRSEQTAESTRDTETNRVHTSAAQPLNTDSGRQSDINSQPEETSSRPRPSSDPAGAGPRPSANPADAEPQAEGRESTAEGGSRDKEGRDPADTEPTDKNEHSSTDEATSPPDRQDGYLTDNPPWPNGEEAQQLIDSEKIGWGQSHLARMVERARIDKQYFDEYSIEDSAAARHKKRGAKSWRMQPAANYAAFKFVIEPSDSDGQPQVVITRSVSRLAKIDNLDGKDWTGNDTHSEESAMGYLREVQNSLEPPKRVRVIEAYTERGPCADRCSPLMYGVMGKVKTQHTLDHPGDGDLTRRMQEHLNDISTPERQREIKNDASTRRYAPGGRKS
ncbi:toxin glutamine deamidase domain-containing protein [Streptomyces gobiensis]|uniref:toxin glutamine deamidase domain-containing protein n=1 Tax=Streptomyces gobiensis TaxID=2875706 RepID=UPI001E527CE5|nr:toxin glutamine deamidase domain-containing protein [Streptomyces gobiensis]UGY93946.1 hypothetical protein test1122_20985 [Streptomyces gobiensis]